MGVVRTAAFAGEIQFNGIFTNDDDVRSTIKHAVFVNGIEIEFSNAVAYIRNYGTVNKGTLMGHCVKRFNPN